MTIISPTDPRITAKPVYADEEINNPTFELARFDDTVFSSDAASELLVISTYSDVEEKGWVSRWDTKLGGLIAKSFRDEKFASNLGDHLLVDATEAVGASAKKYILVVGLGSISAQKGSISCGLYKFALETAEKLQAERLLLPFFPDRSKLSLIAVNGSIAVLRCRVGESMLRGKIKSLKTIKLLVSGQASNAALRGLSSRTEAFCVPCPEPSIVKDEVTSE
ncbi:MAG: hypothetical protein DKT66_24475 [Candidatus Melainabacteria bacterium]|nr:MAG: hypothetical protein DKT66_24475 [Candidatus Melainabacteria bacterium]